MEIEKDLIPENSGTVMPFREALIIAHCHMEGIRFSDDRLEMAKETLRRWLKEERAK